MIGCPDCGGCGQIPIDETVEMDWEWKTCETCAGTGMIQEGKWKIISL